VKIVKNFVKILFPFQYDKRTKVDLESAKIKSEDGNTEYDLFQTIGFEDSELRKGLSDLFTSKKEHPSRIMSGYRVDANIRHLLGLPKRKTDSIEFTCRSKKTYNVKISDISIYLFESGVGFVEVEFEHGSDQMDEFISCNYFLSEIGDAKNCLTVNQKVWHPEKKAAEMVTKCFTMKTLLQKLLEHIPCVTDFYSGEKWEKIHKKGLIYSYVLIDEKPENLDDLLFNMRQNFKESYKAPKKYSNLQDDPAVLQQFENSYWVSSYNGATNISIQTEDAVTNNFFETNFYSRLHNIYFVLFLAALNQKYTILKLMWEMGELDRLGLDYTVMKEQLVKARAYQAETANLKFRDFFKYPSYVQHINDFYDLLYRTSCIEDLYQDLTQDLNNIEEICKVYVERIKQYEALRGKIRKAAIKAITSFLGAAIGVITLLNESWSLLEAAYGIPSGSFSIPVLLVTAVLALPSVVGVMEAIGNVRELRKERKETEVERPEVLKKKSGETVELNSQVAVSERCV